jgi:hypothetical protein
MVKRGYRKKALLALALLLAFSIQSWAGDYPWAGTYRLSANYWKGPQPETLREPSDTAEVTIEEVGDCDPERCVRVSVASLRFKDVPEGDPVCDPFQWETVFSAEGSVKRVSQPAPIPGSATDVTMSDPKRYERSQARGMIMSIVNRCVLAELPRPPLAVGKMVSARFPGPGAIQDPIAQRGWKAFEVPLVVLEKPGEEQWRIVGTAAPDIYRSRLYDITVNDTGTVQQCALVESLFERADGTLSHVKRFELVRQ